MITAPDRSEAAPYYFTYIDKVPPGDIRTLIESLGDDALDVFAGISEAQSSYRYAPEKWSIREVLGHIIDTERLFVFRAMWFARGLPAELPSFDQDVAAAGAAADGRPWAGLVDEFRLVRAGSVVFFKSLPADAWSRRGVASGNPVTVRALAYMTAGHVVHHVGILRERYVQ